MYIGVHIVPVVQTPVWLCKALQKSKHCKPTHPLGLKVLARQETPLPPEMPSPACTWATSLGMFAGERVDAEAGPGTAPPSKGRWGQDLAKGSFLVSKVITSGCCIY